MTSFITDIPKEIVVQFMSETKDWKELYRKCQDYIILNSKNVDDKFNCLICKKKICSEENTLCKICSK